MEAYKKIGKSELQQIADDLAKLSPPAIKEVTRNDNQQVLPLSPTKHKPIEQEHYRQECQKRV